MKFNHISYTNHWRENRLIFKQNLSFARPNDLPTEYAFGQNILQRRIDELDKKAGLSGDRNRVSEIIASISGNKDWDIDELRLKKETCKKKLDGLKSQVSSPDDFRSALNDIDSYEKMLKKLGSPELDNVDIENLVGIGSDFGAFFSDGLSKKLEAARESMVRREKTANALLPQKSDPALTRQAEAEWEEAKLTELRSGYKTNWINRRIAELQAEREIDAESRDSLTLVSQARIHKRTLEIEDRNAILVGKILPREDKLELANILLEAKAIREERVKDYLLKRFETVESKFKELQDKRSGCIGDIQIQQIKRRLTVFKEKILGNPELYKTGVQAIMQASENLDHVEKSLEAMAKELEFIDDFNRDPEGVKAEIMRDVEKVKSAMQAFTPERIDQLIARLDADEKARIDSIEPGKRKGYDVFGKSAIYNKRRQVLFKMKEGNVRQQKYIAEFEARLKSRDGISQEEILSIRSELDTISGVIEGFNGDKIDGALDPKKRSNAEISRRAINLLRGTTDVEKIKQILEENLGKDHFEVVSGQKFENYTGTNGTPLNLKEYTDGNMVFYERGDAWKVIINEEGLTDGKALQGQITHELLHLEFESNEELKKEWLRLFTGNSEWQNIRQTFLSVFPNKKAPTEAGWKDEDILSEIFAMQNDIFAASPESGRLQKAIIDAGITAEALGIPKESIRGYGEEASHADMDKIAAAETAGEGSEGEGKVAGEAADNSYDSNTNVIEKNETEIKRILGSEYISYVPGGADLLNVMNKFNGETSELNEKYKKIANPFIAELIKERAEKVQKDIVEVEKQISQVAGKAPNVGINPLRDMWNRSRFFSLTDILQCAKDFKEWWERRHKRREEEHAARIGSALFDKMPLPIVSEFGAESGARALKAEHGEVDEWQNRLKHKDAWELEEMIDEMADEVDPNKDMFKAVLRILAEKGRINWRNPYLWRLLNKLQSATKLGEDGGHPPKQDIALLKNPIGMREALHKAIGAIWDYDEYLNLERTAGGAYKSGKEKYFGGFDKIQDQITQRLDQLLEEKRSGIGHVDPQEYEGLIEYSIKKGKSTTEDCFFHLMAGVAAGILYADRPLALDGEYMNNWPALQWIYHHKPSLIKADYQKIIDENFPEDYKNGHCDTQFKRFFWTKVQNDQMVYERVIKGVAERGWDHDWTRSIAVLGDANTAKQFLRGRSGEQATKVTAVENAYTGALQWLEENAKEPHKINARKLFARQIGWIAMADGIINRVPYDTGANDTYTRGDASMMSRVPREAGVGNHAGLSVGGHREIIHSFLDKIDPEFFKLVRDEAEAKKGKDVFGRRVADFLSERYPELAGVMKSVKEIDHIYDKMDLIVQAIVNRVPDSTFYAAIASLAQIKKS